MSTWSRQEANEAAKEIFQKASIDKEFRQLVLDNPNEAVKQATGKEVPAEFQIKILESDPDYDVTLLLPDFRDDLSDEDLENVAGGKFVCVDITVDTDVCTCESRDSCGCDDDDCDRD